MAEVLELSTRTMQAAAADIRPFEHKFEIISALRRELAEKRVARLELSICGRARFQPVLACIAPRQEGHPISQCGKVGRALSIFVLPFDRCLVGCLIQVKDVRARGMDYPLLHSKNSSEIQFA